jgi:hypothetical protein
VPWRSFSRSPAPIVPAEPVADTKAASSTPGALARTCSKTRSSAAAVMSKWARWLPNSQNWLSTTLAGSVASALQAS